LIDDLHFAIKNRSWCVFTAIPSGSQHIPHISDRIASSLVPRTANALIASSVSVNVTTRRFRWFLNVFEEIDAFKQAYLYLSASDNWQQNGWTKAGAAGGVDTFM
jgi:hypothetical protein